jgi:hypothetical protein
MMLRRSLMVGFFIAARTAHAESDAALSSGDCLIEFNSAAATATDKCIPMEAFAVCLAKAPQDDKFASIASAALDEAQATTQDCNLKVAPSMTVVDREVSLPAARSEEVPSIPPRASRRGPCSTVGVLTHLRVWNHGILLLFQLSSMIVPCERDTYC